jgi:hypothetical protein
VLLEITEAAAASASLMPLQNTPEILPPPVGSVEQSITSTDAAVSLLLATERVWKSNMDRIQSSFRWSSFKPSAVYALLARDRYYSGIAHRQRAAERAIVLPLVAPKYQFAKSMNKALHCPRMDTKRPMDNPLGVVTGFAAIIGSSCCCQLDRYDKSISNLRRRMHFHVILATGVLVESGWEFWWRVDGWRLVGTLAVGTLAVGTLAVGLDGGDRMGVSGETEYLASFGF